MTLLDICIKEELFYSPQQNSSASVPTFSAGNATSYSEFLNSSSNEVSIRSMWRLAIGTQAAQLLPMAANVNLCRARFRCPKCRIYSLQNVISYLFAVIKCYKMSYLFDKSITQLVDQIAIGQSINKPFNRSVEFKQMTPFTEKRNNSAGTRFVLTSGRVGYL